MTQPKLPLTDRWMELVAKVRPEKCSDEYLERLCRLTVWLVRRSRARG